MKFTRDIPNREIVEIPMGKLNSALLHMRNKKAQNIAELICDLDAKLEHILKCSEE